MTCKKDKASKKKSYKKDIFFYLRNKMRWFDENSYLRKREEEEKNAVKTENYGKMTRQQVKMIEFIEKCYFLHSHSVIVINGNK